MALPAIGLQRSPDIAVIRAQQNAKRAILSDRPFCRDLVGTIGLEPTTPTMSRWCSNQLSYVPAVGRIIRRSVPVVKRNFIKKSAALNFYTKRRKTKKATLSDRLFSTASRGGFDLVGTIGFEPTTPTMSRWCSNQLSYVPAVWRHSTHSSDSVNCFFQANSLNIKRICQNRGGKGFLTHD